MHSICETIHSSIHYLSVSQKCTEKSFVRASLGWEIRTQGQIAPSKVLWRFFCCLLDTVLYASRSLGSRFFVFCAASSEKVGENENKINKQVDGRKNYVIKNLSHLFLLFKSTLAFLAVVVFFGLIKLFKPSTATLRRIIVFATKSYAKINIKMWQG